MGKNQFKVKLTESGSFNSYPLSETKDRIVVEGADAIKAGQFVSFTVRIIFTPPQIEHGDGVILGVPIGFSLPQFEFPQREGYITFKTNSHTKLKIELYEKERFVKIVVQEGALKPGEELEVCFGDRRFSSPGIKVSYQAGKDILLPYFRLNEKRGDIIYFGLALY